MGQILKRAEIAREALAWLGTPYHHHGRIKGVGVDCAMLLAEVYEACGLAPHIDAGFYPHDWHLHGRDELFLQWLAKGGAHEVAVPGLGDVGVWRFGRTYSHGGIVVERGEYAAPLVAHAYVAASVMCTRADEAPLRGRPVRWYSMWEPAT